MSDFDSFRNENVVFIGNKKLTYISFSVMSCREVKFHMNNKQTLSNINRLLRFMILPTIRNCYDLQWKITIVTNQALFMNVLVIILFHDVIFFYFLIRCLLNISVFIQKSTSFYHTTWKTIIHDMWTFQDTYVSIILEL